MILKNGLIGSVAFLAVSGLSISNATATETILFNCFWGPQDPVCSEGLQEMRTRIEAATDGRVTISVPPQSLTAPPDQYEGVQQGVMDAAISYAPFLRENSYGILLPDLPFVGGHNGIAGTAAFYDTYEQFFMGKPNEMEGMQFLGVFLMAGQHAHSTTDEPITSLEDLASRKIFATPGFAAFAAATGASVVSAPAVQMSEYITRNVVDGYMLGDWATIDGFKLGDYTTHRTSFERPLQQPPFIMYMNKARFESFSPEDQVAIKAALGKDYSVWVATLLHEDLKQLATEYEPQIPTIMASAEFESQLMELGKPFVQEWVDRADGAGFEGQAALDFFQQRYAEEVAIIE
jgi:TRAP-type C4-dicarboxylate transport system substrate-binding protein